MADTETASPAQGAGTTIPLRMSWVAVVNFAREFGRGLPTEQRQAQDALLDEHARLARIADGLDPDLEIAARTQLGARRSVTTAAAVQR